MKSGTWSVRSGWATRIAASVAVAIAIVIAGAFCPAEAATWSAYVSNDYQGGGVNAITADNIDSVQSNNITPYTGEYPLYLAANPSGTRVYVPNRGNIFTAPPRASVGPRAPGIGIGNVSVIDTATNTVIATIDNASFNEPYAVAVSPNGAQAWVTNYGNGSISIIDTSTNTVVRVINTPCGEIGKGIVFNPDQAAHPEAYMVTGSMDGDTVCVVSSSESSEPYVRTFTVWPDILYPLGEYAVVTPDGSKIYVTGDEVLIIETGTGSYNYRSISPFDLSTVTYLAVSNDGAKVYAAGGGAYENYLEIIDSSNADFNDDYFTDSYVDFPGAYSINAVTIVPRTNLGLVTELNEGNRLWAFDTRDGYDNVITSDALPVNLSGTPSAIVAVNPERSTPPPTLTVQKDGMGGGWIGTCGMVVGRDGKGPMSGAESAGMIALYFGLLLLPVGILKIVHRKKRFPLEKAGIVALFVVASMLVVSSANAERLIVPKAQRFHPTTDGLGALTVDTDQTLCPGQFNLGLTLNGAKKPLDMGDTRLLKIEKVVVDELYTADLLVAYGLTPDITLGLDVPYEYSRDNLNYTQYKLGNTGVRDDVFHLGDIRLNAKFRVIEGARYGLALIPFANFATGNKDYLLSEGKFGFGMKFAGHYDVIKPLTLYANLGAEHVGNIATPSSAPGYYTPWIQYGVGAKYLLPWRKDSIVAEVNGETAWSTPFAHSTLSPLEVLAAYRAEVAPGWTLQAGGGGGLNKGMGAPQWRAILGIAYKM
ncbi:MAG: YncE family protein [bacterium]|nr:YncE family protein [bacterium]